MVFTELEISKDTLEWLKEYKFQLLIRCALHGHDYRNVDGIDGGPICVCCGNRPNKQHGAT